jgi:DNA-binding CsgD family transcriptional regulator
MHAELTRREIEIPRLIARGLSDARTKLRLPSRSAAIAYAAREGVL